MNKLKYRVFSTFKRLFIGLIVGFLIGYFLNKYNLNQQNITKTKIVIKKYDSDDEINADSNGVKLSLLPIELQHNQWKDYLSRNSSDASREHDKLLDTRKSFPRYRQIFIGVMTTRRFLATRARAAYDTWVPEVEGRVVFFSAENSRGDAAAAGIPNHSVVSLNGVDDTYPPQKKSFLLLKYMHDVYIDHYEWFMRADDDLYIRADRLTRFLRSVNASQPLYIGQSGRGNMEEFDTLSLDGKANYCMGGPGMIFSRETLKRMVPKINHCLANLYTTHEDVEIGRCVKMFARVDCTWAFQMQKLFHHNKKEKYVNDLNKMQVKESITLHPVKTSATVYYLHRHFLSERLNSVYTRRQLLLSSLILLRNNGINGVDDQISASAKRFTLSPSLLDAVPRIRDPWNYFDRNMFTANTLKSNLDVESAIALYDATNEAMKIINGNSIQIGRIMTFNKVIYGFRKVHPLFGATYILDIMMSYIKFDNSEQSKKMLVRRHTYLHQSFLEAHCIEYNRLFNDKLQQVVQRPSDSEVLHIIVPLSGRYEKLVTFVHYLEEAALYSNDSKVIVAIMLYTNSRTNGKNHNSSSMKTKSFIRQMVLLYPFHEFIVKPMTGEFSRARALTEGSRLFHEKALLVFIDVDIAISKAAIHRFKINTIIGKTPYFPIVFSRYKDKMGCQNLTKEQCSNVFLLSEQLGYWRNFGFGIASVYNSDFNTVGGFDLSIKGWGREDVDLFRKFVRFKYTTFRGMDPGLIHLYHAQTCDPHLSHVQMSMCRCSRASTHASMSILADLAYAKLGLNATVT